MRKAFGKNDVIFIGVLLALCLAVFFILFLRVRESDGIVAVTRDGELFGRYALNEAQTVEITDASGKVTNVLVIEEGCADMKAADCPDRLCVHQHAVSRVGETIVCLPNRVVVTVESGKEDGLDGFAQ